MPPTHRIAIGMLSLAIIAVLISFLGRLDAAGAGGWDERAEGLQSTIEILRPLHKPLGQPKPGEWLAQQKEAGQTFKEYVSGRPIQPTKERGTIYILPIGDFTPSQRKVIDLTAQYLGLFYSLPVSMMEALPENKIPPAARRANPFTEHEQFLSTYILNDLLKPRLPRDGCVILGLTATDLWPGKNWNFVFGQASISERVGVWSIHRKGDPSLSEEDFRICLLRTIKTAVHETGHMFSIRHCTAYECLMCGSNSLAESDGRPLAFCPECMAKVCWATKVEPLDHMKRLAAFCKGHGFDADFKLYASQISALEGKAAK